MFAQHFGQGEFVTYNLFILIRRTKLNPHKSMAVHEHTIINLSIYKNND